MTARLAAGAVLAGALAMFLTRLGSTDLWAPDEPRYAAVAEELRSGEHGARGLLLLHLNGAPYTQKPPLYFWLAGLAGAPGGRVSEWAARLPSALAGVASVGLLVAFGARTLGTASGVAAGALLLTAFEFAHRARRAQLDVLLTLFELVALVAFFRLERGASPHPRRDLALLHASLGLAVLTKGPVGLLVPSLAMLVYLAWQRRLRFLRRLLPAWALLLSLAPGLAWLALCTVLAPAGFLGEAVGENLLGRFFSGTSHARPAYYYLYHLPLDFLPWTLLWPLVALRARAALAPVASPGRAALWRLSLVWVGTALVFFSLSSGKRGLYLLPVFPALALLCGDAVVRTLGDRSALPRALERGLVALAAALALAAPAAIAVGARFHVEVGPGFPAAVWTGLALGAVGWRLAARASRPVLARAAAIAGAVASIELAAFAWLLPALDPEKSPQPVARAAAALTPPGAPIGLAGRDTLIGGLLYYGGRPVAPLDSRADIDAFLARGGRAIVVSERRLAALRELTPLDVRARARRGERALLVVSPVPIP